MTARQAYVVLGGAGRLGQQLLPRLGAQRDLVIGLSRQARSDGRQYGTWVEADLTIASQQSSAQSRLRHLLKDVTDVDLVDLVLDRTAVTSMRRSIAAATTFAVRTCQSLTAEGRTVRVLAASTTAVLAPPGFQTPYGKAKRQQAVRYAQLDRVDLVLLPQLLDIAHAERLGNAVGHGCTYQAAAGTLSAISSLPSDHSLWVIRGAEPQPNVYGGIARLPRALGMFVVAQTVGRNSLLAHRRASRERLALLPPSIRAQVDHHGAPERLVRAFEKRVRMPPARSVIAGSQLVRPREDDARRL